MRILFDECLPGRKLKRAFAAHKCRTAAEMDWRGIVNGDLLRKAEPVFDAFITVDRGLRYQQKASGFDLVIVVLRARSNRMEHLLPLVAEAHEALLRGRPGEVLEVGSEPGGA